MSAYHLYAVDDAGRSVHMSHIHGRQCLHIPDEADVTIVLEHTSGVATFLELKRDGSFDVLIDEHYEYPEPKQPAIEKPKKRRRGRRRRKRAE